MRILVVLDTNVLVSALLKPKSIPDVIVRKSLYGEVIPVLNDDIIAEYDEVLHRKKFNFSDSNIQKILDGLKQQGMFLNPAEITTEQVLDEKDVIFYAVTMEARKEEEIAYLVTGNIKHFPITPYVVTPREFLTILVDLLL